MERNGFTRAGSNGRLTLAVPSKGRMGEPALRLCADAGLSFEATDRALLVPCANAPVDLLLVRAERRPRVRAGRRRRPRDHRREPRRRGRRRRRHARRARVRPLHTAGRGPEDAPQTELRDLDGLRVATAYPASTRACLAELGIEAELVPVSGSVEAAPRLGLSDAIVDLVSTGSTASANGLRLIGTLLESQAVLVGGRHAPDGAARARRAARADALRRRRRAPAAVPDAERPGRRRSSGSRR